MSASWSSVDPELRRRPMVSGRRKLSVQNRGGLEGVQSGSASRRAPSAGEVEIAVDAAGLNFKDVLNALGMYPGDAGPLGGECTGTIVSVGPGVKSLAVGDRVIAVGPGCHDGYVCVRQELAIHRPANFTLTDAAGFAIPFLTASYTLEHLAKLQRGERVLIHAATGGVGLAAVQIAQHAGAEIFATAGTAEKRQHLRSLGIRHVFDSRSTDFAAAILRITNGTGVHVVLNSLAGGQLDCQF